MITVAHYALIPSDKLKLRREAIDKRNFRKRILALDVIEPTGDEKREGPHRPAKLYRVIDRSKVDVIK